MNFLLPAAITVVLTLNNGFLSKHLLIAVDSDVINIKDGKNDDMNNHYMVNGAIGRGLPTGKEISQFMGQNTFNYVCILLHPFLRTFTQTHKEKKLPRHVSNVCRKGAVKEMGENNGQI